MEPPDYTTQLKVGDICSDCQQRGIDNRLRIFLINLNEDTILKCQSDSCMYPYNDDLPSSEDENSNNIEFIEPQINFTNILPNLFHNNEHDQPTVSINATYQPNNFVNKVKTAKVERIKKSNDIAVKSEPILENAILFQFGHQFTQNSLTTKTELLPSVSLPQNIEVVTMKTKQKNKRKVKTEDVLQQTALSSDTSDDAKSMTKVKNTSKSKKETEKYNDKSSKPISKAKSKSKSKIKKELEEDNAKPPCTSIGINFLPMKCEAAPAAMDGIPKASLIKGHQYLKLIDATNNIKNTTKRKRIKAELTSSEDELYSNRE